MTLVLSNDDVEALLPVSQYIASIEKAYRELGQQKALIQPRMDMYSPSPTDSASYVFKSMIGMLPSERVVALRINSDIIGWNQRGGALRKEKVPAASGNRWVGLVFLFDMTSGELIAVFPDGVMQRWRVAATSAVAAKHLARPNSSRLAVYGSGWQAEAAVHAMTSALPTISSVVIWSPTETNRQSLVERCLAAGVKAEAANSASEAAEGADAVVTATNSIDAVISPEWLAPGAFVSCVKAQELGRNVLETADRIVLHTKDLEPRNFIIGEGSSPIIDTDPIDVLFGHERGNGDVRDFLAKLSQGDTPTLSDVILGKSPGRTNDTDQIVFLNPLGNGLQFAAVGRALYSAAKQSGRGNELPGEWFSEDVHP